MAKKYLGILIIFTGMLFSVLLVVKNILNQKQSRPTTDLKEASYYTQLENGLVRCELCPNRCLLKPGQRGLCNVRENINGKLYSLVYGQVAALHLDPIEKKPLFHFLPGSKAYSLATVGCNLDCQYCQNWDIAHRKPEEVEAKKMTPEEVVQQAQASGAQVIAFTYNEPVVWYEYMRDIAQLAHQAGLKTVMITNGYINPQPLKDLLPFLDAVKIDLKAFNQETYAQLIRGRLEPVLEAAKIVKESGTWLEIVHLVVPGYTDDLEEIKQMCSWIKENLGPEVPVHFSRFWPQYKLRHLAPTAEETVKKARQVCLEAGLNFVYTGNIDDPEGSTTYCPDNHQPLIRRRGYLVEENLVNSTGQSPRCPKPIPGVWH